MSHAFLSDEWMAAVKEIRNKYGDQVPKISLSVRINQVVTDVPFGDGTVTSYFDTSSGDVEMDIGELEAPDATITTDYLTAKAMFVDGDQAVAMQAFMAGKIKVQGDMMKIMAIQTAMPQDELSKQIAEEIKAMTD